MKKSSFSSGIAEALTGCIRAFGTVICWCFIGAFVVVTVVSIVWKMEPHTINGLDEAAASLPSVIYKDMMGMEVAMLSREGESSSFSAGNITSFVTRLTTGIDPGDPRTLAAQMLPGAEGESGIVIIRGIGTEPDDHPIEVPPAPEYASIPEAEVPLAEAEPDPDAQPDSEESLTADPDPEGLVPPEGIAANDGEAEDKPTRTSVFVYHSHPEESFLSELQGVKDVDLAFAKNNKAKTVTAVGSRLAESLQSLGVGTAHSDEYYPWEDAYNESRKTVKAAMQSNKDLQFFFDIHRDSARKDKTVLEVNGTTYAKLYFVIGQKNPDYKKNESLAAELHNRIEEKVSGLSRGVFLKKAGSNGEFNQSLSPQSVLIEVGGVDNTLEECYRTADVLAEVIAEIYWEQNAKAVKADAPVQEPDDQVKPL